MARHPKTNIRDRFPPGTKVRFTGYNISTGERDHPLWQHTGVVLERHHPTAAGYDCTVLVDELSTVLSIHWLSGVPMHKIREWWLMDDRMYASGHVTWEANMSTELDRNVWKPRIKGD